MANKPLSAVIAGWIHQVTGGTPRLAGQATRSSPADDKAIGDAWKALTDHAASWPDDAQREEARTLANEVVALLPGLKRISNRAPEELAILSDEERKDDAATAAGLYTLAARNFVDLSRRIAGRDSGASPLPTEVAELRVLRSGIRVCLDPTEKNQEQSADDGKAYAMALLKQVTNGKPNSELPPFQQEREVRPAINDFDRYIAGLIEADEWVLLAAATRAISDLGPPPGKDETQRTMREEMAVGVARRLGNTATKALAATRQLERTSAERSSTDVLVHLTAVLRQFADRHPEVAELKELQRRGQALFMAHRADRAAMEALLEEAQALEERAPGIAVVAQALHKQLPDKTQSRTQQQDNLYGRVFETKFAAALVADPPAAFIDACYDIGRAFADRLEKLHEEDEEFAKGSSSRTKPASAVERSALEVAKLYDDKNPRPWSRSVPAMGRMAEIAKGGDGYKALEAIMAFFDEIPETGQGIVAAFSLMVQLSAELAPRRSRNKQPKPEWMIPADRVYKEVIIPQKRHELIWAKGKLPKTDAVGITLLHQPTAAQDPSRAQSMRAATYYRSGERQEQTDFADLESSDTMSTALEKALPYGTGASGNTNMLLHLFHHLKETEAENVAEIPAPVVVMMSAMLLIYNGGHSLHEVLWVANLLDRNCALGLDLGDPDDPNAFVSDYDAFFGKFDDATAAVLRAAADQAYGQTQDYLEQHSVFADVGASRV
jgi:hypothetical protein